MGFNPFAEKGRPLERQIMSWKEMNSTPYVKHDVDPYTRCRIIVMNGTEFEAVWFGHQHSRHCSDMESKRKCALLRRIEQQQQKLIASLVPADETVLEHTIGYEQVAVDLTAWLARHEPDPLVKAGLDFALLEDFDHLYRYANLLEMTEGVKAERLVGDYTEIIPGRPTIDEHRHPFDDIRMHYDAASADIRTKLNSMIIVGAEQQTMNFYMNVANRADTKLARGLYSEIAMVEEQHVTHYESLLDPTLGWGMRDVMHHYVEAYLYWSFAETESDERIRKIWQDCLEMEIGHLQAVREMFKQDEGKDVADELPGFPEPMTFESNVDYVRKIEAEQVGLTGDLTEYVQVAALPGDHRYFAYQDAVNKGGVPSEEVIKEHIRHEDTDYRLELAGPHPIPELRVRDETLA